MVYYTGNAISDIAFFTAVEREIPSNKSCSRLENYTKHLTHPLILMDA